MVPIAGNDQAEAGYIADSPPYRNNKTLTVVCLAWFLLNLKLHDNFNSYNKDELSAVFFFY